MGNIIKCSWSILSASVFKEFIQGLITFQLHYLPTQSRQPDSTGWQFAAPRSGLPSLPSDKREGNLKITLKIWYPISSPTVNTLSKALGFFPSILEIQKWGQTPILINRVVSAPDSICILHREINDFQARSKGYCLVTAQIMSYASQYLIQLKWQCRTGAFSVTDGFASILFQSLMLKYVSHYAWLQADCICYPRLLLFFFSCWDVQIWKFFGGVVGISEGIFYHPSWRAGALSSDVVTDASVLAWAPLLALWAMLPGGTQVLTAVHRVGTAQTPITTGPSFVFSAIIISSSSQKWGAESSVTQRGAHWVLCGIHTMDLRNQT